MQEYRVKRTEQDSQLLCIECGSHHHIIIAGFCLDCREEIDLWLDGLEQHIADQIEQEIKIRQN